MIKHIVMWKLKDFVDGKNKEENAREVKRLLEALNGKIPGLKAIEVGINIEPSEQAYDVVLYSEFDSLEALNGYQKHPEHLKAGEFVGKVREARTVVDYEI
jgi:heme-degrading monooxygenase HmoA